MGREFIRLAALALALCLLTGCSALLERTYSTAEPHSSKFWESEAAGTLRAENHQDVVNDLLLLVGQHRETATLRLYDFENDMAVADTLERAAAEVQQETPMGAYAVEYITTSSHAQRGYYEVAVRVSYRRTLEQLQAVVNATSPEALYSLLSDALDQEKTELAVRVSYWGTDGQARVEDAMLRLREERELTETVPWVVNYYPARENPGLVEFLLDPPEPEEPGETPPEEGGETLPEEGGETLPEEGGAESVSPDKDAQPPDAPDDGEKEPPAPSEEPQEPQPSGEPEDAPPPEAEPSPGDPPEEGEASPEKNFQEGT